MKTRHEFPKEHVRSAIRSGIMKAEKQKKMCTSRVGKRTKAMIYTFCSVVAVFIILIGSSSLSPSLASSLSQLPIIGSVFGNTDLISLKIAQDKGLTSAIGETQEVDGISVTLDEILYDQNNITVGLVIESERELEEHYFNAGMDITINGKHPASGSGSYGEDIISDTTRTAIQTINLTDEMPESFELGLILHGEAGETWYFSTPIQKISNITRMAVNHSQTVDGLTITIPELSISETGISIAYESIENETDFDLSRGGNIEFLVTDQDGNEVTGYSGGSTGELIKNKISFKSNKQFDPIDDHVIELIITPYLVVPSAGGGVKIDENGVEKELPFKGDSIKPVKFDSFKVNIK